jgi:hypothetical protein
VSTLSWPDPPSGPNLVPLAVTATEHFEVPVGPTMFVEVVADPPHPLLRSAASAHAARGRDHVDCAGSRKVFGTDFTPRRALHSCRQ